MNPPDTHDPSPAFPLSPPPDLEPRLAGLDPDAQAAFAALAAFAPAPSDFSRDAALAVCGMPALTTAGALRRLAEQGFLTVTADDRLALPQPSSDAAVARLGAAREPRDRHAVFYRELVKADPEAWPRIAAELDQIQRAWAWVTGPAGDPEEVLEYVAAMNPYFERRGSAGDHRDWLTQGLHAARTLDRQRDASAVLNLLAHAHSALGDRVLALACFEEALSIDRAVGDRAGEAATLTNIGDLLDALGDRARALTCFELALPIARDTGDSLVEASILGCIGDVLTALGDRAGALERFAQALPIARAAGDRVRESTLLNSLGLAHHALGDRVAALDHLEQALSIARAAGDRGREAQALTSLGVVHAALGDPASAEERHAQALPLLRAVGDRSAEATALARLAAARCALGDFPRALERFEEALAIREALGEREGEAALLRSTAVLHEAQGNLAEASARMERVLAIDEALELPALADDRAYLDRLAGGGAR